MNRREMLVATSSIGSIGSLAGCLEEDSVSDQDIEQSSDSEDGASDSTENQSLEEDCRTEPNSKSEDIITQSQDIDGDDDWTQEYQCEDGDTLHFDISVSNEQDVEVEIVSPQGQIIYSQTSLPSTITHQFDSDGKGEVRITNLGKKTEEEREKLMEDRVDVGAGNQLDPWVELREESRLNYYIRMVDGARPKLRIEDSAGNIHREHSKSEAIGDSFTAPEDDRYYFIVENTALMTTGTWDYVFERVEETPIPATVELTIEREYEEEVEICD
ncbi:hypothetical protein [Natronococcus pandeyae]|uniref:hypothetical protein n=1 Tax=Natronococcus pandeyae TaxID=2055836 RepID=UPI0011E61BF7|nr:hypothetical protein [Natronococcus pandeyae]